VFASDGPLRAVQSNDSIFDQYRFREDYFDPISHIRRGRFYSAKDQDKGNWHVQPHPALPQEAADTGPLGLQKTLETFRGVSIWAQFFKESHVEQPLVLFGRDERFTIWTIISLEVISTEEELITLKARRGIGVLPVIDFDKIKEPHAVRVREALDAFVDEVHRAAPISVIDRARDAASQILLAHFQSDNGPPKDLMELAKRLEGEKKIIAAGAAKIIARLHSRGKPTEREKYPEMRPIREEDAQLAIQCVGTLLCELGWADWR
tara:strand:+ start:3056 stop:3847 length:792 start_codon:yes stop_codon:yes gene_type:complete